MSPTTPKSQRLLRAARTIVVLTTIPSHVLAADLPAGVMQLLPPTHTVMTYAPADLNSDGRTDYVVVLRNISEGAPQKKGEPAPTRPLLVFLQSEAKVFKLVGRNDKVVFAADEGGQCDPFLDGEEGIAVKMSYFTVQNSVACGQHWTDYFTFRYAQEQKAIVFHKRIAENWVMNPSTSDDAGDALVLGNRTVVAAKKNRPVFLDDYRP